MIYHFRDNFISIRIWLNFKGKLIHVVDIAVDSEYV